MLVGSDDRIRAEGEARRRRGGCRAGSTERRPWIWTFRSWVAAMSWRRLAGVIDDLRRGPAGRSSSSAKRASARAACSPRPAGTPGRERGMAPRAMHAHWRRARRSPASATSFGRPRLASLVEGEAGSIVRRLAEGEPAREEGRRSPEALRFDTLEAIATFASGVARRGPVILCFEDLHWSDPSTLDAVRRLRDVTRVDPVAVIATVRVVTEHASKALLTESTPIPRRSC